MQWSAGLVNPLLPFICSFTGGIHHQATYCSSPVASSIWPPPLSYSGTAFFPQCYHKNTFSRMELNCYSTCSKQASKAPPPEKGHNETKNPAVNYHVHWMVRHMWIYISILWVQAAKALLYTVPNTPFLNCQNKNFKFFTATTLWKVVLNWDSHIKTVCSNFTM